MSGIIDFHTHAFPDPVAARAIPALEAKGNVRARLDGTVAALLTSMDQAGIERSVICSIATRPEQYAAIRDWSQQIRSSRIEPLLSVHPADPGLCAHLAEIAALGFRGIKVHPYYQDFVLDEERLAPLYRALIAQNLFVVCHTGYDIGFPRDDRAAPRRIAALIRRFPDLRFIATHLGAWDDWVEVRRHLLGRHLLMDMSFSLAYLPATQARALLQGHSPELLLFGSDSPWDDQHEAVERLRALGLDQGLERRILHTNALRLLQD